MNRAYPVLALIAAGGALLAGCGNTLKGAQQDANQDTVGARQAAANAANATKQATAKVGADIKQTGQDVKQVGQNAEAATVLTPVVKTAIVRDPVLNDKRNLINVKTTATAVTLTGHVADDSMKQRATEDAQKVLSDHHSVAQVVNDLTVTTPAQ